jgi:hypothetical protein
MTWTPPKTEQDWDETLSAFIDEEFSPEDQKRIEEYLASSPLQTQQLRRLKGTSSLLSTWRVEVPESDADFVREFERSQEIEDQTPQTEGFGSSVRNQTIRWAFQSALFATGVLVGIVGTVLVKSEDSLPLSADTEYSPPQTTVNVFVSPSQAETLLQETAASELVAQVKFRLREQEWGKAVAIYEDLMRKYPETLAASELEKDLRLSFLERDAHKAGRI